MNFNDNYLVITCNYFDIDNNVIIEYGTIYQDII